MDVKILGPVEAWVRGQPILFSRRQQRLILGVLALEGGRLVSRDQIVHLLWDENPPFAASSIVQTRVSEIKAILSQAGVASESVALATRRNGYVLQIEPECLDAHRFRELAHNWRECGSDERARSNLRTALQLWRGPVFGGRLTGSATLALVHGLEAARLTATEDLYELELRAGRHYEAVDKLVELVAANRTRERLLGQMMVALYRTGRGAEALHAYDRWRRWLGEELGADPSSEVADLHVAILNNSPHLSLKSAPDSAPLQLADVREFVAATPRTLPPAVPGFTGRQTELALLRETLVESASNDARVINISGPGGIGKTALAIKAGHDLSQFFPDGQLYVNLRGADHEDHARPFDVLGRCLRSLGIDGAAMPGSLEERTDLYRDLTAGRQILVVLDNAASEAQVLPLLPGSRSCSVVITSRRRLGSTFGAQTLRLDVLETEQAADLLSVIAGASRIAAEPDEASQLIELCGNLPLALRVAGAKLAAKPYWTVKKLTSLLADEHRRLDHLAHESLDVRASISLSYSGLPDATARALRLLADLDLPEVTVWSAAALLDSAATEAEYLLDQLFDAQLLDVTGRDVTGCPRYWMHDLIRVYAREQARLHDAPDVRAAARARVYSCCLSILDKQYQRLCGESFRMTNSAPERWSLDDGFVESILAQPLGWFENNRQNIAAVVRHAYDDGQTALCWETAATAAHIFQMRLHLDELQTILETALEAATRAHDVRGCAAILHRLASNATDLQDYSKARDLFQLAGERFAEAEDRHGSAMMTGFLAMIDRFEGDNVSAMQRYLDALSELRQTPDLGSVAWVLRGVGLIYLGQGELSKAESCLTEALSTCRSMNAIQPAAQVLYWYSMLNVKRGRHHEAISGFQEALDTSRTIRDQSGEAQCLRGLAIAFHGAGDHNKARTYLLEALQTIRQPRPTIVEKYIRQTFAELFPNLVPDSSRS